MNFISLDINPQYQNLMEILERYQSLYEKNNQTYTPMLKTEDEKLKTHFYFAIDGFEKFLGSFPPDNTPRTLSEWVSLYQIPITDNIGLGSRRFLFGCHKLMDFQSPYWYAIQTETDIRLEKPSLLATSKELAQYKLISHSQNLYGEKPFFRGESGGASYPASSPIMPLSIDNTLKTLFLNKIRSMQDILIVESATDANPMDFIVRENKNYLLIDKIRTDHSTYRYTCVSESCETHSYSNGSIVLTDTWHEVGAAGEPAFQNSWTNWNTSSDSTAGFTKVGSRVYIKGTIKSGAHNTAVFTLPAGYRPIKHRQFPCLVWNNGWAPAGCHVSSAGVVTVYFSAITHWFSLNGIDFDVNT